MFSGVKNILGLGSTAPNIVYGKTDKDLGVERFVEDDFWKLRIRTVAANTLPSMHNVLMKTGRWEFFDFNWKHLKDIEPHIFWDSDIAKFLEAVCYALKYTEKDEQIYQTYVDWIDQIVRMAKKAQQPDGYLNSYFTQMDPKARFTNIMEKHELYCCGHLIEAAVAHHEATGSMELVDIMCKYVDLLYLTFGPGEGQLHGYPGHEEIELALVKLLRIVPKKEYFDLLNYFVEERGQNNTEFYNDELRRRNIDPDVYNPLADYDHMDSDYTHMLPAPKSYWYSQSEKPIRELEEVRGHSVRLVYYLTGVQGLAMLKKDDSLKKAVRRLFDNMIDKKFYIHGGIGAIDRWEGFGEDYDLRWDGYSETCASIGLVFLCERMLSDKLDKKVALAMERALYNDVLGGVSVTGKSYYYNQPSDDLDFKLVSKYPNEGKIELKIDSKKPITISIREPNTAFRTSNSKYKLSNGYLTFGPRIWTSETITIEFDIPVEIVKPDPNVTANSGHLAVQRGPYAYALQKSGVSGDVSLDDIKISVNQKFEVSAEEYENAKYVSLTTTADGRTLNFVPYFITGNEHPGEDFRLWIKDGSK
ncbi:hypothetical protein PSN45_003622 [Yamadazyma tenuis]|uniref:uncharacterized protein n=1 Tax=Candida tenuis TaxID=2315449 RepID=UPI002799BA73|nr:hypothetical protein PSN45_003622 [Yamadazyma tenuis]